MNLDLDPRGILVALGTFLGPGLVACGPRVDSNGGSGSQPQPGAG